MGGYMFDFHGLLARLGDYPDTYDIIQSKSELILKFRQGSKEHWGKYVNTTSSDENISS